MEIHNYMSCQLEVIALIVIVLLFRLREGLGGSIEKQVGQE